MTENAPRHAQTVLYSAGSLGTLFAQWLISVLIPRFSGFSEAGVFSLSISVLGVINIIATCNMTPFQAADRYREYSLQTYVSARYVSTAAGAAALMLFAAVMQYDTLQNLAFAAYFLYRLFYYLSNAYIGALQVKGRLDLVGKAMLWEGMTSFLAFFVTYSLTHSLIFAMLAMALAGGAAYFICIRKYYAQEGQSPAAPAPFSIRKSVPLLKRCFPLMLATMLPIALSSIPKIALQRYAGNYAVGIYGSLAAPTIVLTTLGSSLFSPIITNLSASSESGDFRAFGKTFGRTLLIFLSLAIAAFAGSILLGRPVLRFLFGKEIDPYTGLFPILVAGISLCAFANAAFFALISLKRLKTSLLTVAVAVCASAVIIIMHIRDAGISGACYGTLLSYAIMAAALYAAVLITIAQLKTKTGRIRDIRA